MADATVTVAEAMATTLAGVVSTVEQGAGVAAPLMAVAAAGVAPTLTTTKNPTTTAILMEADLDTPLTPAPGGGLTVIAVVAAADLAAVAPAITTTSGIDVGTAAIDGDRTIGSGYTCVSGENAANATGVITVVEVWANTNIGGFRVGTFYAISGGRKCRDSHTVGDVTAGNKYTIPGLSLSVVTGDYIGCYFTSGVLEVDGTTAFTIASGEHIDPGDEMTSSPGVGSLSLYGLGHVVTNVEVTVAEVMSSQLAGVVPTVATVVNVDVTAALAAVTAAAVVPTPVVASKLHSGIAYAKSYYDTKAYAKSYYDAIAYAKSYYDTKSYTGVMKE